MTGVLKKGLGLVVVLFVVWFLFTNPAGLATLSKHAGTWIWDMLVRLFSAISSFLTTVLS